MFSRTHLTARRLFCAFAVVAVFATFSITRSSADTTGAAPAVTNEDSHPLPDHIAPADKRIQYEGRFDTGDPAGPRCSWSASAIRVKFQGTALDVDLSDPGQGDAYEIVEDGLATGSFPTLPGTHAYRVFTGSGTHTLSLVKRTEAFCGITQFLGFDLAAGGKLLDPGKTPTRKIEVIGDSISCGYGDEAASQNEHFTPATENAYLAYGAVAARSLGAEYTCVAWSGKKMWPDNTLPELYDRTLPTDPTSKWDYSRWTPDVAVINLATNDWARGAPDETGWTAAYEAFIGHVRQNYPKAMIYCMSSPMMSGGARDQAISYLTKIVADRNAAGDTRVKLLIVPTQDMKDGIGADWHPNATTHTKDAAILDAAIEHDLGWKPVGTK